ncbi:MAG: sigma factor-like helix-turn-helix DNA-binding protein [Candidatus Korobacteraceae bacterium]
MRAYKLAAQKAQLLLIRSNEPPPEPPEADDIDPRPEMLCFRGQTFAFVRHFFELSCQAGRLPSILGRELFRARVSHHAIPSFEDQAIFIRDIELCLEKLSDDHAEIITLVGMYDFSHEEVAEMLRCSKAWIAHRFAEAIDHLTEIFLAGGILSENRPDRRQRQVTKRSIPRDIMAGRKKPPARAGIAAESGTARVACAHGGAQRALVFG